MKGKKFNIQLEANTIASINLEQIISQETHEKIKYLVDSQNTDYKEVQKVLAELKNAGSLEIDRRKVTNTNYKRVKKTIGLAFYSLTKKTFENKFIQFNFTPIPNKLEKPIQKGEQNKIDDSMSEESKPKPTTPVDETTAMEKTLKNIGRYNDVKDSLSMTDFLELVDCRLLFYKVTEPENKKIILQNTLVGHPCNKIIQLPDNKNKNYDDLKKLLALSVDGKAVKPFMRILEELQAMKLKDFADLADYFQQFCLKASDLGNKVTADIQVQAWTSGLPNYVADYVSTKECTTLTSAYEAAVSVYREKTENYQFNYSNSKTQNSNYRGRGRGNHEYSNARGNYRGSYGNNSTMRGSYRGSQRGNYQNQRGSSRGNNYNRGRGGYQQHGNDRQVSCFFCQKTGHRIRDCHRFNKVKSDESIRQANMTSANENHQNQGTEQQQEYDNEGEYRMSKKREKVEVFIKFSKSLNKNLTYTCSLGSLEGRKIPWVPIADCGATLSTISLNTVRSLKGVKIDTSQKITVTGFDGKRSDKIIGRVKRGTLFMKSQGSSEKIEFAPVVVNSEGADLLGLDIIKACGGCNILKSETGELQFRLNNMANSYNNKIYSCETKVIPPGGICRIKIRNVNIKTSKEARIVVEPRNSNQTFSTPYGVLGPVNEILLINPDLEKPCKISNDQHIANCYVSTILPARDKKIATGSKWSAFEKKVQSKVEHIKNTIRREKVKNILLSFWDTFDEGCLENVSKIDLEVTINPGGKPIQIEPQKRRSFNPNVWSKINTELDQLEKWGLIEDVKRADVPPANLVAAKRRGSDRIRLCVDYTTLNKALPNDFFPLPQIQELLNKLSKVTKNTIFTKIDACNHFYGFPLKPEDRNLTSFYTEQGIKRWLVLPFGIKTAPAIVQRYMAGLILGIQLKMPLTSILSVFIDDILLASEGEDDAENDLVTLLTEMRKSKILLKLEKLDVFKKTTEFMGCQITATENGTMKEVPESCKLAIESMKKPETLKELRSVCGCFNAISDYLPDLQTTISPLYELIGKVQKTGKKDLKNQWEDNHQQAFEKARSQAPLAIKVPDFEKPFFLEVDSSEKGHGGYLAQDDRICGFASKALRGAARNYENAHRELAGVVFIVENFQTTLQCSPFEIKVYTDNKTVEYIRTAKSPKLRRWKVYLDSLSVKLIHRAGKDLHISDCLSRQIDEATNDRAGTSDELLAEQVIARANATVAEPNTVRSEVELDLDTSITLFQLHQKLKHCSPEQLHIHSKKPVKQCRRVVERCYQCLENSRVKTVRQIDGTLPESSTKSHTWYIDFTFHKNKDDIYLTILDRSTRFLMIEKMANKRLDSTIKKLNSLFRIVGKPEFICGDGEFKKTYFIEALSEVDVEFSHIPRHSPQCNLVERIHQEIKKIYRKNNSKTLFEATDWYNNRVFCQLPAKFKSEKLSPNYLFHKNPQILLKKFCDFRRQQSENRQTRQQTLRGANFESRKREYGIGDLVRFNVDNKVAFGEVKNKNGKLYEIKRLDKNHVHSIHSKELAALPLPKDLLTLLE